MGAEGGLRAVASSGKAVAEIVAGSQPRRVRFEAAEKDARAPAASTVGGGARIKKSEVRKSVALAQHGAPSRSESLRQIGAKEGKVDETRTNDKTGLERKILEMNEKLMEVQNLLQDQSMLQACLSAN